MEINDFLLNICSHQNDRFRISISILKNRNLLYFFSIYLFWVRVVYLAGMKSVAIIRGERPKIGGPTRRHRVLIELMALFLCTLMVGSSIWLRPDENCLLACSAGSALQTTESNDEGGQMYTGGRCVPWQCTRANQPPAALPFKTIIYLKNARGEQRALGIHPGWRAFQIGNDPGLWLTRISVPSIPLGHC